MGSPCPRRRFLTAGPAISLLTHDVPEGLHAARKGLALKDRRSVCSGYGGSSVEGELARFTNQRGPVALEG
jgi:hypothetical protein